MLNGGFVNSWILQTYHSNKNLTLIKNPFKYFNTSGTLAQFVNERNYMLHIKRTAYLCYGCVCQITCVVWFLSALEKAHCSDSLVDLKFLVKGIFFSWNLVASFHSKI